MVHTPGKPSALNPRLQMTYKRMLKIERIARLTLDPSGFSNAQIANMLNCHQQTVVLVRQLPEFHAKVMELSCGVLSSYDAQLRANIDNARQELRDMVPTAMNVIKAAALGKLGAQLQYKAATDILDREGNLAKVSKTSVSIEQVPNMQVDPLVAANLLSLLSNAPPIQEAPCTSTPNAFTKSGAQSEITKFELSDIQTEESLDRMLDAIKPDTLPN
jgi:hypothetical protein